MSAHRQIWVQLPAFFVCRGCNIEKPLALFPRAKDKVNGRRAQCSSCTAPKSRAWRAQYPERARSAHATYYAANKERCNAKAKEWREAHPNYGSARASRDPGFNTRKWRRWFDRNKPKSAATKRRYQNNRRSVDLSFRLSGNLRSRIVSIMKGRSKGGSAVRDLGCSVEQFKRHLELKFKPGMSWDNWGFRGWHIDHIEPLASFDMADPEQFKKACHYTNLQPLWAKENMSKSARKAI